MKRPPLDLHQMVAWNGGAERGKTERDFSLDSSGGGGEGPGYLLRQQELGRKGVQNQTAEVGIGQNGGAELGEVQMEEGEALAVAVLNLSLAGKSREENLASGAGDGIRLQTEGLLEGSVRILAQIDRDIDLCLSQVGEDLAHQRLAGMALIAAEKLSNSIHGKTPFEEGDLIAFILQMANFECNNKK